MCIRDSYSTSKKFKKAKTVTVKSGKAVKKTISKLKSKKTDVYKRQKGTTGKARL